METKMDVEHQTLVHSDLWNVPEPSFRLTFCKYVGLGILALWWLGGLVFVYSIVTGYPIVGHWNPGLPDLDKNTYNRMSMQLHFVGGMVVQLLGPFQFLPILRKWGVHKWMGRLYLVGMCGAVLGGEMFLLVNPTVGGINMSLAFATYGILFFLCGGLTYYYAKIGNYRVHSYCALLTFSLGIGSWIYRLLYVLSFLGGYTLPCAGAIRTCHLENFKRPWDAVLDWLFFVPNVLIACVVIFFLKKYRNAAHTYENAVHAADPSDFNVPYDSASAPT